MGLGLLILQWKQQDHMVVTHRNAKKCPFLKLNCELMENESDFIFGEQKVQTVWNTQKENFDFPIVTHTFSRLGHPTPKFRQICTITQKRLIFRGFKCDFWIPCARYLACTNF